MMKARFCELRRKSSTGIDVMNHLFRQAVHLGTLYVAAFLFLVFASPQADAAEVPWKSQQFELVANGRYLRDLLRNLGASQGIPTWVSPQIEGGVNGRFNTHPQRFLEMMSESFGISWYYDGSVLFVYGANETRNVTLRLSYASTQSLQTALDNLGVSDRRFPIRFDRDGRVGIVSGPPRFVELVTEVAQILDRATQTKAREVVRVFPLRYARAADHTVQIDGKPVTVPGIARILNSIYDHDGSSRASERVGGKSISYGQLMSEVAKEPTPAQPSGKTAAKPGTFGAWLAAEGVGAVPMKSPLPDRNGNAQGGEAPLPNGVVVSLPVEGRSNFTSDGLGSNDPSTPSIQADPRTNSIVIRDLPDRMDAYRDLIASLDTKPKVIEISATIIDITDSALAELGIDWRLHTSHVDFETGNGRRAQAGVGASLNPNGFDDPTSSSSTGVAATPIGGVLTAVIGGPTSYLLSRISALQQADRAHITETPKIATLDNVEAVMSNKQTMYVRVAGYQTAELYSIAAGVSLRVLPSVVEENGTTQLRLGVHIEDGQLSTGRMVDQIPIVSNSQIDTQALIEGGQSLLIAGYSIEQSSKKDVSIPVLSKIPVLGNLFEYSEKSGQKYQRLFLVTPRVLSK